MNKTKYYFISQVLTYSVSEYKPVLGRNVAYHPADSPQRRPTMYPIWQIDKKAVVPIYASAHRKLHDSFDEVVAY